MSFTLRGLGTSLPQFTMSQSEATELAREICARDDRETTLLKVLYRRSGVKNRHTVLPHRIALQWLAEGGGDGRVGALAADMAGLTTVGDHAVTDVALRSATKGPTTQERMQFFADLAPPLAIESAGNALTQSGLKAREITHLVTVSCTGFAAPGVDVALISTLDLAPTVQRVNVGFMGCHGAINGLRVAQGLLAADPRAAVLLCATELCSIHYRFQWDPDRMLGNALFADGSAAIVATHNTQTQPWQLVATGSCLLPDSTDAMSWFVGDHGFEMYLSSRVPEIINEHLRPWLSGWLAQQGLTLEEVGSWAVHPGGPRILSAVEEALGLAGEATAVSREVLSEHGNMSSPTVLFILDRLIQRDAPRPVVMLGFGPGLVAEVALWR